MDGVAETQEERISSKDVHASGTSVALLPPPSVLVAESAVVAVTLGSVSVLVAVAAPPPPRPPAPQVAISEAQSFASVTKAAAI
jgi:hypothetical protein